MTTAINAELGLNSRLYVAETATPAGDWDYIRVKNENAISYSYANQSQEIPTKENGGQNAILPGVDSHTITVQLAHVYDDDGFPVLKANKGKIWPIQVRYILVSGEEVQIEGPFLIQSFEQSDEASGARTASVTLQGSGNVVVNEPRRAVNEEPAG